MELCVHTNGQVGAFLSFSVTHRCGGRDFWAFLQLIEDISETEMHMCHVTARSTPLSTPNAVENIWFMSFMSPLFILICLCWSFQKSLSIKMNVFIASVTLNMCSENQRDGFFHLINNRKEWMSVSVGYNLPSLYCLFQQWWGFTFPLHGPWCFGATVQNQTENIMFDPSSVDFML